MNARLVRSAVPPLWRVQSRLASDHAFELVLFAVGGIIRRCPQPVLVRQFAGLSEGLRYQIVVVVCEIPDVLPGGKGAGAEKSEDFILRDFQCNVFGTIHPSGVTISHHG